MRNICLKLTEEYTKSMRVQYKQFLAFFKIMCNNKENNSFGKIINCYEAFSYRILTALQYLRFKKA